MDDETFDYRDSQKEKMRQMRREAYRRAKALRDADPKFQALKEEQKQQRRAFAKKLREEAKSSRKQVKSKSHPEEQEGRDEGLWQELVKASELAESQQRDKTFGEEEKSASPRKKSHLTLVKS